MTSYEIRPAITASGEPIWALYRTTVFLPWSFSTVKQAENADRGVLEHAIKHLTAQSDEQSHD